MQTNARATGQNLPGKRGRYKREILAQRRYRRMRRLCIALSIGFLLATVWMVFYQP